MCEVTKQNFKKLLPEIKHNLSKSTFVAIDCEFSGLLSKVEVKNSLFDSASERYLKLKENVNQLIALQFGISAFRFVRDFNEYTTSVYNFYVFPRSFGSIDIRFLCQSSSIEFLCGYNFNFNKVVYDGIPFLNKTQQESLRNELKSGALFGSIERTVSLDDEKALQEACSVVSCWVSSNKSEVSLLLPVPPFKERYSFLLHHEIRARFKAVWTFSDYSGVLVKRVSETERLEFENSKKPGYCCDLEEEIIDELSGFKKVFDLLVQLQKPIVGHNLFLDLLIMYKQFHEPLPDSLTKFKKNINRLFPTIMDTKFISYEYQNRLKKEVRFGSNSLGNLYDYFQNKDSNFVLYSPHIKLDPGYYEEVNEQQVHEAGWDSYITGFCFIKMAHSMAADAEHSQLRPLTSTEHFAAVKAMKNRVNIVRATLSHINLEGSDPVSTRPPLLYVRGRDKKNVHQCQLSAIFAKYGAVDVKQLSSNSALVAVSNFGSMREILKDFDKHSEIMVEKYKFLRHSRLVKSALWSGVLVPMGFILYYIYKGEK